MNHLLHLKQLKNRYYLMRHGQSKANIQQIIVSHPAHGMLDDFALTKLGREQAARSARVSLLPQDTIIYSSDFSRARETAEIVQRILGSSSVVVTPQLRERNFGRLEKTDHSNYKKIWALDRGNANHRENKVESVNAVLDRVTGFICELEQQYNGQDILLVSHGDTLQILQTGFEKVDPAGHRGLPHLETAEVRQVWLANKA